MLAATDPRIRGDALIQAARDAANGPLRAEEVSGVFNALGAQLLDADPGIRDEACRILSALVGTATEFLGKFVAKGDPFFNQILENILAVARGQVSDLLPLVKGFVTFVPEPAIVPLLAFLYHGNAKIRARIIKLVVSAREPRTMGSLVQATGPFAHLLTDPEPSIRADCAWGLGRLGQASAVPSLLRAASDPDPLVRAAVATALGTLDAGAAVPILLIGMRDSDKRVREAAEERMTGLGKAGIESLRMHIDETTGDLYWWVLQLLARARDEGAIPRLAAVLRNSPLDRRKLAVEALTDFRTGAAVAALCEALADESSEIRAAAASGLHDASDPGAIQALCEALKDPSAQVRAAAASSLTRANETGATQPLCAALTDGSAEVRCAAARALGGVTENGTRAALLSALQHKDEPTREAVVSALGQDSHAEARSAVVSALDGDSAAVRRAAVWAVGRRADPQMLAPLLAALRDSDEWVRAGALDGLSRLDKMGVGVHGFLATALKEPAPEHRAAAIAAMLHLGNRQAVASLVKAASDPVPKIRELAMLAMRTIKSQAPRVRERESLVFCQRLEPDEDLELGWEPRWKPKRPPTADAVSFTLVSPARFAPGQPGVFTVWAHLPTRSAEILALARNTYGDGDFRTQIKWGARVMRGAQLTVRLKLPAFVVDDPEDDFFWEGEIGNATFPVLAPEGIKAGTYPGIVTVHVEAIRIAKLHFAVDVAESQGPLTALPAREERCRKAFASYASEDRPEVLARVQGMQKAARLLDVFLDVHSLRSGENWEKRLMQEIADRDVFYLFWSAAASRSAWVEKEWRKALELRGIDYIDPVPLVSPAEVPPPKELGDHLHFNDWVLAYLRSGAPTRAGNTP
jgi:HEAT repeat protein